MLSVMDAQSLGVFHTGAICQVQTGTGAVVEAPKVVIRLWAPLHFQWDEPITIQPTDRVALFPACVIDGLYQSVLSAEVARQLGLITVNPAGPPNPMASIWTAAGTKARLKTEP
jgi:hypothetical protein